MKKRQDRFERLMPNGIPRYIRIYDNGGKTFDRYTAVFAGNFKDRDGQCFVLSLSSNPKSSQGVNMFDIFDHIIDYPTYSHLGKKITFNDLPDDCKDIVISDYFDIWNLIEEECPLGGDIQNNCAGCVYNSDYKYDPIIKDCVRKNKE